MAIMAIQIGMVAAVMSGSLACRRLSRCGAASSMTLSTATVSSRAPDQRRLVKTVPNRHLEGLLQGMIDGSAAPDVHNQRRQAPDARRQAQGQIQIVAEGGGQERQVPEKHGR